MGYKSVAGLGSQTRLKFLRKIAASESRMSLLTSAATILKRALSQANPRCQGIGTGPGSGYAPPPPGTNNSRILENPGKSKIIFFNLLM